MRISRRILILAFAAISLVACQKTAQNASSGSGAGTPGPRSAYEKSTDMALGPADAKAVLIEYASVTCVHCRDFHLTVFPTIKREFIDKRKIRFVFREFPTPPAEVSTAGMVLARCAGPDKFFDVISGMFDNLETVFQTLQAGQPIRELYFGIAERKGGLTTAQAEACLADPKLIALVAESARLGNEEFKITGTPALILNGKRLEENKYFTQEGLSAALNKAIAGEPF